MNSSVEIWDSTCDNKMKGKCNGGVMMVVVVVVVVAVVVVEVQPGTAPPSSVSGT